MKKYDNREEMKRILLAGDLNSNNDDSWSVKHILNGATPDFTFHGYDIHSGASKLCLCNDGGAYVCKWVTDDRYNEAVQETKVYAKAVEAGLEKFFPYTEIAFEMNGITFVFQEKVQYSASSLPYSIYSKFLKQCKTSLDCEKRIWKKWKESSSGLGIKIMPVTLTSCGLAWLCLSMAKSSVENCALSLLKMQSMIYILATLDTTITNLSFWTSLVMTEDIKKMLDKHRQV